MICPACGYQRTESDRALMPGVCPDCGIAYVKYQAVPKQSDDGRSAAAVHRPLEVAGVAGVEGVEGLEEEDAAGEAAGQQAGDRLRSVLHLFFFVPADRHESVFWGHTVLYLVFLCRGWYFIAGGIDWQTIGGSFLHRVNLVFHEFGHVAFSPFGQWWTLLGGSLFQVLLPLLLLVYFVSRQRDNFAASLMLWWTGQNLIDVSPYIADAPTRMLPLIGGDSQQHDWWNLLQPSDALDSAPLLAQLCFGFGALLILLANLWGALLLYIEFRGRTRPGFRSGSGFK